MKNPVSKGAVIGSLIAVVVVVVIAAVVFFKPSLGPGPVVVPQKFKPPAGYDASKAGKPIGAPGGGPDNSSK